MLQTRFIYVSLLFVVTFFYLFSSSYMAFFLFWFVLSVSVFNVIYILTLKNKVSAKLTSQSVVQKTTEGALTIRLKNNYILPIPYIRCTLLIKNKLTNETREKTIDTSLNSFAEKDISIYLKSDHSGAVDISVKKLVCYDFFRVLKKEMHIKAQTSITFVPVFVQGMTGDTMASTEMAEVAMFSSERKGNLNEEMIALKEYVPGDNVKHIHWKLSSKLDDLIVKELADVREEHIVVLFETSISVKDNMQRIETIDRMMDTFGSVMKQFLDDDKQIHVAWYDDDVKQLYMEELYGITELQPTLRQVLNVTVGDYGMSTYEQFLQKEYGEAVVFYVTTEHDRNNVHIDENSNCIPIYAEQWDESVGEEIDYGGVM